MMEKRTQIDTAGAFDFRCYQTPNPEKPMRAFFHSTGPALFSLPVFLLMLLGSIHVPAVHAQTASVPLDVRPWMVEAVKTLQAGRLDEAMIVLEKIEAAQPDLCDALILRASVLLKKGDTAAAKVCLDRAESLYPGLPAHLYNRAEWHFVSGDYASARDLFAQVDSRSAQGPVAGYKMVLCESMQAKESEDSTDPVVAHHGTPRGYYERAARTLLSGRKQEGLEWIRAAWRIYPAAANLLYAESLVTLGLVRPDELPRGEAVSGETSAAGLALPEFDLGVASVMKYASQIPAGAKMPEGPLPGAGAALIVHDTADSLPSLDGPKKRPSSSGEAHTPARDPR